jgi:N-acetylglucosaminyldiphosphoundecaprenol N-acetyl-beta-D-mannosaminyltransferase
MKEQKSCAVLGVPLAVTDYKSAVEFLRGWVGDGKVHAVAAANTHLVTMARHDPEYREAINQFDYIVPDGMPLIWTMNRRGAGLKDRVYGPTLMLHAVRAPGVSHFLLGGTDELLVDLTAKLKAQFPEIQIAGSYAPPFGTWPAEENQKIRDLIARSGAQFIWVGLGCPKQERWIAAQKANLPPGVYFGIGAAFAFHAGRVRQAPLWIQGAGLEWLFRLCTEPRRLWRRYFTYNSLFLWYLFRDWAFPPASLAR